MVVKVEVSGDTSDSSFLLELAANNDLLEFKRAVGAGAKVDGVGNWYSRRNGTSQMGLVQKTPAMVASMYGSVEVLHCILNCYMTCGGDINRRDSDGRTALHCAAAGGASGAVEAVSLLLSFGADLNAIDAQGHSPYDVTTVSPKLQNVKLALERLLRRTLLSPVTLSVKLRTRVTCSGVSEPVNSNASCLPCSESVFGTATELDGIVASFGGGEVDLDTTSSPSVTLSEDGSTRSPLESPSPSSSPKSPSKSEITKAFGEDPERAREYPVDPSLPDIKNGIYMTDEFRMFSFKVRPCARAYCHDWTECPFVHPGENARRRDPRRYHYSCVPCPDFRKGACRCGDSCEYAHGVFECWLHPAQYRTRLCKDGTNCARRVCFFAHTTEELRPLYVSTGSAVPSPRSSSPSDICLSPPLTPPVSASSVLMMGHMSPSNPGQGSLSTPPLSLSSSTNALVGTWVQPNIPTMHLPGVLQSRRLRAALNSREISLEDLSGSDFDGQMRSDSTSFSLQSLSTQARLNAAVAASVCGNTSCRSGKFTNVGLTVAPTDLEELFTPEMISSTRSAVQESSLFSRMQTHKIAASQIHSHVPNPVLPQVSSQVFPQTSTMMQLQLQQIAKETQLQNHTVLQSSSQSNSFMLCSSGHLSSLGLGVDLHSGNGPPVFPTAAVSQVTLSQQDKSGFSLQELESGPYWSDWGSPTGRPEWGTSGGGLYKYRKSTSFSGGTGFEEPDVSWVQGLVKEGPSETEPAASVQFTDDMGSVLRKPVEHSVLSSLIEQMHLDQIVA